MPLSEEAIPYFPPHFHKARIKLPTGEIVGYALECADSDMDACIFERHYRGGLKDAIDGKVGEIMRAGNYCTKRMLLINDNGGIVRVLGNFTGKQKR